MSHVRQQIRTATVSALSSIGGVFAARTVPLEAQELAAILVYTNSETIARSTVASYMRTLELDVEIVAKGRDVDEQLDALLARVEPLLNDSKLGGLCKPMAPAGIEITVDTSGSTPIGRARMVYRVVYFTDHATPEVAV